MSSPLSPKYPIWYSDAERLLQKFEFSFDILTKDDQILEISCGGGNPTFYLLYPAFRERVNRIVAVDKDPDAVKMNSDMYTERTENKLLFDLLDVTDCSGSVDRFVEKWGTFKFIFSFGAPEWSHSNQIILDNIKKLLCPGGQCLLAFIVKSPIYQMYRDMAKIEDYTRCMRDYMEYIPQLNTSCNPGWDFLEFIVQSGMEVLYCNEEDLRRSFACDDDIFYYIQFTVHVFQDRLYKTKRSEFLQDCVNKVMAKEFDYPVPPHIPRPLKKNLEYVMIVAQAQNSIEEFESPLPSSSHTEKPSPSSGYTGSSQDDSPLPSSTDAEQPLPKSRLYTEWYVPSSSHTEQPLPSSSYTGSSQADGSLRHSSPFPSSNYTERPLPRSRRYTGRHAPSSSHTEQPLPSSSYTCSSQADNPLPSSSHIEQPLPSPSYTGSSQADKPLPISSHIEQPLPSSSQADRPLPSTEWPLSGSSYTERPLPRSIRFTEWYMPSSSHTEQPLPSSSHTAQPLPSSSRTEKHLPSSSHKEKPSPSSGYTGTPFPGFSQADNSSHSSHTDRLFLYYIERPSPRSKPRERLLPSSSHTVAPTLKAPLAVPEDLDDPILDESELSATASSASPTEVPLSSDQIDDELLLKMQEWEMRKGGRNFQGKLN